MTAPNARMEAPVSLVEQQARVVAVAPGLAWLETSRKGACGGCAHANACATPILGTLAGHRGAATRIEVTDHLGLGVGDGVVVGIPAGTLTRAAALAYLLPPALLVLASLAAGAAELGDLVSALIGLFGLVLGFGLTRLLTGGAAGGSGDAPVLVRRQPVGPRVAFDFQQRERGN